MIEYKNYRSIQRHMLDTGDLDALEIYPQRKSHHGYDDAADHLGENGTLFFVLRTLFFALSDLYVSALPRTKNKVQSTKPKAVPTCMKIAFDAIILRLSQSIQNSFA